MRKLVVSEFVSLDGIVEDPRWTFQFESEERNQFKFDELAASDALLLDECCEDFRPKAP